MYTRQVQGVNLGRGRGGGGGGGGVCARSGVLTQTFREKIPAQKICCSFQSPFGDH